MPDFFPSAFIANLSRICRENLLAEKWLLAPNRRVGHQWAEQAARSGQPVVNLRVTTLTGLALRVAGGRLNPSVRVLTSLGTRILIDGLLAPDLVPEKERYLTRLLEGGRRKSPGLVRLLADAIEDMRMSGAGIEALRKADLEVPAKKREMEKLLGLYLAQLDKLSLTDRAGVFSMAIEELVSCGGEIPGGGVILLPEGLPAFPLEERLIEGLSPGAVEKIAQDAPAKGPVNGNISLLGHIASPGQSPPGNDLAGDKTAVILPCVGEINEVRAALGTMRERGVPFDRAEILVTDAGTYIPMIYEEALRLFADPQNPCGDAPVTFADGIPTRYSRPGRALSGWIQWVREEYSQPHLVRLLEDGLLDVDAREGGIGCRELSRTLRALPAGSGRDRYLEVIGREEQAAVRRLARFRAGLETGEAGESDVAKTARQMEALKRLRKLVEKLLGCTPADAGPCDPSWFDAALAFLGKMVRGGGQADNFAREAFKKEIAEFREWSRLGLGLRSLDIVEWLASLPGALRIGGRGPAPGCLHVSSITSGGHSGRPFTAILGLDDSRFPGGRLQDPVFLDRDREQFHPPLPTSASRFSRKMEGFAALLRRLRGEAVLTWSCRSLSDDREMFPSPVLLSAFRILYGNREADLQEMSRKLGPPRSFAPSAPGQCLTADDWWMLRCCGEERLKDARAHVFGLYPHIKDGAEAMGKHREKVFSEMSGYVPEAGPDIDPTAPGAKPLSPSRAEKMGGCPLRYFLSELLGIEPPEEVTGKIREWWLDPMQFGSLLHEILAAFTERIMETGEAPDLERHLPLMDEIVRKQLDAWRRDYPPPSEDLFHVQERRILKGARRFLREEEELSASRTPVAVELPVGMESRGGKDGHPDPVPVRLPGGRTIRIRGRIDRVDRGKKDNALLLTDFKSGQASRFRYQAADPTIGGRQFQAVFYRAMALAWAGASGRGEREVGEFRYVFPTSFSSDGPVIYLPGQMDACLPFLERAARLMAAGVFPATDDADRDCRYCPFNGTICPNVEEQAGEMAGELAEGDDPVLDPFRAMRGYPGRG